MPSSPCPGELSRASRRCGSRLPFAKGALLACRPVSENYDARVERLRVHKFQKGGVESIPEETFPTSQDDGKNHDPVLVDEAILHQRVHEICAAEDQDVLPGFCFSLDTCSATPPSIRVELFHSRSSARVVETTCLGWPFIMSAYSWSSARRGP